VVPHKSQASEPITERGCRLLALFGTFWPFLAPFGTLFRGGARKTEKNAER
jgi:hypothetical protein